MSHIFNILAALMLALTLGLSFHLDDPDFSADARKGAAASLRKERGAAAMCQDATGSINTVAIERSDGSFRCATKRGHVLKGVSP